ncbi:unnamed protein product [Chondrus crispus]|uniref:DUF2135 domain-containing protein n=1 Tax=Chondrus crispus TaxID=2769 RepID=R7Q9I4_CHOCR|nr:unnamed protein product [Chondrus crispus]CDF34443.1 unnamed protein product [Chondrus crispus]|eukprot:XP_005714262.1 unnamed protein product [Chondrus crispus]
MASRMITFALFCAALALTASAQCGKTCRFRFCRLSDMSLRGKGARTFLRAPFTSLSGVICLPGSNVTDLRSGQAMVAQGKDPNMVPISQFSPAGLDTSFPKRFFRLFPLQFVPEEQGMGRLRTRGNQQEFLDDLCVVLPITSYGEFEKDESITRVSGGGRKDCVSFRTRNPMVLIELSWDSADDFDLEVTEPNGTVVSRDAPDAGVGELNNDNNVGACNIMIPAGKEAVLYRQEDELMSGDYTATIKHFNNCGDGRTRYRLRVIVDGEVVVFRTGLSNAPKDTVVTRVNFSL